ncbi:MAG TPA: Trm112 family protein [Geobacteraceae bacterium]
MALSKELLDILACPKCKRSVALLEDESALICAACGLKYPVRDGIPVMLLDEAENIDNE